MKAREEVFAEKTDSGFAEGIKFLQSSVQLTKPGISVMIGITSATATIVNPIIPENPWQFQLILFISGYLCSSGSAVFNQLYEMELDKKMERTKYRPLPSSQLTRLWAGFLSIFLLSLGLLIPFFIVGFFSFLHLFLGAFSYIVLYTVLSKTRTSWNVPIGGLCGAFAAMAGASSPNDGHLNNYGIAIALILYLWSAPHFWSLAILKAKDYKNAEIPMLPVVFGNKKTSIAIFLHTIALIFPSLLFLPNSRFIAILTIVAGLIFIFFAGNLLLSTYTESEDSVLLKSRKTFLFSLLYLPIIFLSFWMNQLF